MADEFSYKNRSRGADAGATSPYARSEGIGSYKRRRRRSTVLRVMVLVLLAAVLGSAALLFGRSYFDYGDILPGLPQTTSSQYGEHGEPVQTEEIVTVQPAEVTLAATGDVVLNGTVIDTGRTEGDSYDFSHLFAHVEHEVAPFDLRVVSQETSLAGSSFGYGYVSPLNAPQELGRAEVAAGFNVILRACDHTLDTGRDGIHNELLWWHNDYPEVPVLGMAEPDPQNNPGLGDYVNEVYVYDQDGMSVGVLNHTWGVYGDDGSVVSPLTEEKIAADVARARELGAQAIVACVHWGNEGSTEVNEEQARFAQYYADQGVDVIIGNHPRVLQRTEVLHGAEGHTTVCFYSLGCLTSSADDQGLLGGLAEVTLSRDETGACTVSSAVLKPVITHRASGQEWSTYLVSDYPDELAYSSWDGYLTRDELNRRCVEVLGEQYNIDACELRVV